MGRSETAANVLKQMPWHAAALGFSSPPKITYQTRPGPSKNVVYIRQPPTSCLLGSVTLTSAPVRIGARATSDLVMVSTSDTIKVAVPAIAAAHPPHDAGGLPSTSRLSLGRWH